MGQFDDPNYVEYIKFEQSINQADDKDEADKKENSRVQRLV